jgi:iron complex transport system ATP-binding protein
LRTLVRIQELLQGEIFLNEKNIDDFHRNEFAKAVSFVSTGVVEIESMTIRELVSLGRFPHTNWIGSTTREDDEIIDSSMYEAGIYSLANRKLIEISDGERQKAMIARTLAQNTPVIILDEPTSFLDLPAKYDLINLLHKLTTNGRLIIYSSHDLNISLKFSDRLWIIDEGKIFDGSPEDMILNNTFARIFESDKISFNSTIGDFELKRKLDKEVILVGDDRIYLYWTMQALTRNGYHISDSGTDFPVIRIKKENDRIIWILQKEEQNLLCESIYEMLNMLDGIL